MGRRFALLDRDGTLIEERHYLSNPQDVELIPGVVEGLRQLQRMGVGLVVITNQSGISRGFFNQEQLEKIHQRMSELLKAEEVCLDGIYFCPHTPEDRCRCRKPGTGLVENAARELNFDLRSSFVIGDKACDIEMGRRIGATTFLVRTGYGASQENVLEQSVDYVVDTLREVVPFIARLDTSSS